MEPLRTRVYIDGFNFYYGCLKNTQYKWLDYYTLFEKYIIPNVLVRDSKGNARNSILLEQSSIKLFTALIIQNVAKSTDSVSSQAKYHQALKNTLNSRIEIINGYYSVIPNTVKLIDPKQPNKSPNECKEAKAWKVEEKQTDVNLALEMYHDASAGNVDHVIVVSNDTDLAASLKMIRKHAPAVKVGLVVPLVDDKKFTNKALSEYADWTRGIKLEELAASQLPRVVKGRKRATTKPISWYPNPENLQHIIDLALPLKRGKISEVFKWLDLENEYLSHEKPIELLNSEEGFQRVISYIKEYKKLINQ